MIRGESEGFHTIDFNIAATLEGLATGPVEVVGKASGGVLVRNGFFDMTFTLPSVVRKGEEFTLFVTVTNIGESLANDLSVSLDTSRMSGVELLGDDTRQVDTLFAGDSNTFEFLFEAQRTGQVVADYLELDTDAPGSGKLQFTLGIGERGVPLSPDTLVLPASVDLLPDSVVQAAMRVLGQSWSIANAPAGTLPPDVIRISRRAVTEKALALAEAGLRVVLGQDEATAVRDVAIDFYGGSPLEAGFDQLLRQTRAGRAFALALGLALEEPMFRAGGLLAYEEDLAEVAASGPDFLSLAVAASNPASVDVVLSDGGGRSTGLGRSLTELPLSEIPGAVFLPLGELASAPALGLLTAPAASPYVLELIPNGPAAEAVDISVTLPRGDGTFLRGSTSLSLVPGGKARLVIDLFRPDALELGIDEDGDGIFELAESLSQQVVSSDGPHLLSATVIGPEILDGAGPFGFHAAVLFDRVVDESTAGRKENYQIPANEVRGANPQLSGRLVFAALAQPEGPYIPTTLTVGGIADRRGVVGPTGTVPVASLLEDPGSVVSGRVLFADGTPVTAGTVVYSNFSSSADCGGKKLVGLSEWPLTDGRFEFRYVRRDHCGGPFRIFNKDTLTGERSEVSGYVRTAGEHITLDLVRFGRGSVTGLVTEGGLPGPGAQVVVVSGTDSQNGGSATTDGDGRYTVHGILVGPVSVTSARGTSLGVSAGRVDRAGTTAVVDINMDGGTVRAEGTVKRLEAGTLSLAPQVQVVYSLRDPKWLSRFMAVGVTLTEADGSYRLDALPAGDFKLEALLSLSDRASIQGFSAAGDVIAENLVIDIPDASAFGTVKGVVILPDQTPAEGVAVTVGIRGVRSQSDGSFEIPGIEVKPFTSQTVQARTRDGLRFGTTAVVVNEPGQVVDNLAITLSGLGTAEFHVLDAGGEPISGIQVGLPGNCLNACACVAQTTDSNGVAVFEDRSLGTVHGTALVFGTGAVDVAKGSATLLHEGETAVGVLQFAGVGTVTGTVLDPDGNPAFGAEVTLMSKVFSQSSCSLRDGNSHQGVTGQDGKVTFTGVNLGRVSAYASHPFFPDSRGGSLGTLSSTEVPFELEIRLVDTMAGALSGTVFLPAGETPAGAGVEVTVAGPLPDVVVKTDGDGRYEFAEILPQGSYTLTARDPVTGGLAQERIYLRAVEDVTHNVRLKGRGTVHVRVVNGADEPVDQAFVRLTETDFPRGVFEGAVEPATEGVITFDNVFEGPFSIEAHDAFGRDGGRVPSELP